MKQVLHSTKDFKAKVIYAKFYCSTLDNIERGVI